MKKKAFTLIELLIVVAIIGILASVVLVSLNSGRTKAKAARSVAQLKSVNTALEAYYASEGSYPVTGSTGGNWQGYCSAWGANLGLNWIPELKEAGLTNGSLPIDPRNNGSCFNDEKQYIYASTGEGYKLISINPESMQVPSNLIDPVRPNHAWGWWTPNFASQ